MHHFTASRAFIARAAFTAVVITSVRAGAQTSSTSSAAPPPQTEGDAYTRYELLAPGSAKFRIIYEVTATTPGATYYFNPIRKGSVASDESVSDRATGKPLPFDVVGSTIARAGGVRSNDTSQTYIRVKLSHPVPPDGGEARVLIDKTYEDATSYFTRGDTIVFTRPLGIKRNAIVLPRGYELISCNFPSQILQESDGRIGVSFWNDKPSEAPLTMRAKPVDTMQGTRGVVAQGRAVAGMSDGTPSIAARLDERAHQNRKIVYYLQQPETHAFDLYHDYTESKVGTSTYLNVVRAGSAVSKPRARNLDTGEDLKWEIHADTVVFRFAPVKQGESIRLRMYETYTDTARYKVVGDELLWDRSFGRPANAVILPAGWMLTNSSVPATVSTMSDGRVRLDFINPRTDEIGVLITAKRR